MHKAKSQIIYCWRGKVLPPIASILFFTLALSAYSAGDISMEISPQPLMAGEPAQLQLTSSEDYPEITELPKVAGIAWQKGVSQSKQVNVVNFKRTSSYISVYEFIPQKEGELEIPALKLQCGKKKTLTDPVKLKVMSRKFSVSSDDGKSDKKSVGLEDILFLRCSLLADRKTIYVGEEIFFEIKIYGISGLDFDIRTWPEISMGNVVFRDFSQINPKNGHFSSVTTSSEKINGQSFNVYTFRSALRPIAPGKLKGQINASCIVKIPNDRRSPRSSDPFEDFFSSPFANYKSVEQVLNCQFPEIEALSLPESPGTANYLGLIGNWKIKTELDLDSLKTGEPATLRISGTGEGTADTLKAPEIRLEGFRTYPPEIKKSQISTTENFEIKYVLIPLNEGSAEIRCPVSYFSTASGKYVEVPFTRKIKVAKSDNPQAAFVADSGNNESRSSAQPEKKNGTKKINDILYLKRNPSGPILLPLSKNHLFLTVLFFILGPAIWGFSEYAQHRRAMLEKDPVLRRKLRASSMKGKLLREIRRADPDKLELVIRNDVVPYLNDLTGLPPGTSAAELAEKIDDRELADLLRSGAHSAYMPGSTNSAGGGKDLRDSLAAALKKFSLIALLLLPVIGYSDILLENAFNPLNAYNKGEFAKVADYYRKQIDMNSPDPALLYNLGNCLYQLGEPAKALVMYERALHLSPRDTDIRENLNLIHRKLGIPEVGTIESPKDIITYLRDILRPDEWMLAASIVWLVAGIILALRRKFASEAGLYTLLSCIGIIFILATAAPISQSASSYSSKTAFAVIKNMQVYLLPSESSRQTDFRIGYGEKLFIEEERDNWLRIRTMSGSEGWIKADTAERLLK